MLNDAWAQFAAQRGDLLGWAPVLFGPGFPKWPRDLGLSALLFVVHFCMLTGARGWIHGTPCRCGF